jgi:hypothetical protein
MASTDLIPTDAPPNGAELPTFVRVSATPRLSPNELRVLKAMTGRTLETLMNDEADAMQAMVWLALRRAGHHDVTWDQAGDVEADMTPEPPDPTPAASSMTSPPSAASGAAPPGTSTP